MTELEGYKTVPATPYGCDGCAFDMGVKCVNELAECIPATRSDGRNVIFVKVENDDR